METTKPAFTPWRADFKESIILCAAGVMFLLIGGLILTNYAKQPDSTRLSLVIGSTFLISGIAFFKLGIGAYKRGYFRRHGSRVEKTAVDQLAAKLPVGWKMLSGVASSAGGDIDVIINTGKTIFAVEIKSPTSTWGCHSFFRRLFGFGIDPRADKAVGQAKRNALAISHTAIPILWLPLTRRFRGMRHNTLIVGGNAKHLIRSLS